MTSCFVLFEDELAHAGIEYDDVETIQLGLCTSGIGDYRIVYNHVKHQDIDNRIWIFVIEAGSCDFASLPRADSKNQP